MSYDKRDSENLSIHLSDASTSVVDASNFPPELKIKALQALVKALETALSIALAQHYGGTPEPFPGACKAVLRQSLQGVDLARKSNLVPPRDQ